MKPNVWNIKDVLSIPTSSVLAKSGKGSTTSDYSSLTDSQFLFGSQFWPENSQGFSQEISGPPRGSQTLSQEVNERKVSNSYLSKPLLFGDGKTPNVTGGKTLGMLDRFEEEKRKAKENEILTQGFQQLLESLESIKRTFLNFVDGSCDDTKKTVAEGIHELKKTIQDDLASLRESIAGQADMLVNLQSQTEKEIKDSEAKTTLAVKDMSSLVLGLQQDLQSLRAEHCKEQHVFGEVQSLLNKIMAAYSAGIHSRPVRKTDNSAQTSPGLVGMSCVISEEKQNCNGMKRCTGAIPDSKNGPSHRKSPVKENISAQIKKAASFWVFPASSSIEKQKQLFKHPVAERSCKCLGMTSASSPAGTSMVTADLQRILVESPVFEENGKPLNVLNQNTNRTWNEVSRQNRIPKKGQRRQLFRKKRVLVLPQRRQNNRMASVNLFVDNQHDEENRVPLSAITCISKNHPPPKTQQGSAGLTNKRVCAQHLHSWSWSPSSDSSQMMVEYEKEQEVMIPEANTNSVMQKKGIWQLFDFDSDSD